MGKVLLNFTDFQDEEILPRMAWAGAMMRANACDDPSARSRLMQKARRKLSPVTGWFWRLRRRFRKSSRLGPLGGARVAQELARMRDGARGRQADRRGDGGGE